MTKNRKSGGEKNPNEMRKRRGKMCGTQVSSREVKQRTKRHKQLLKKKKRDEWDEELNDRQA